MTDLLRALFPLTTEEWQTAAWYAGHGLMAFLVILIATAVLEHFWPEEWPR